MHEGYPLQTAETTSAEPLACQSRVGGAANHWFRHLRPVIVGVAGNRSRLLLKWPAAMAEPAGQPLTPLLCPSCEGPVPLADGAKTPCPYCGARVEIPETYRALRAAQVERSRELTRARELFAVLGKPPALLYRSLAGWFSPVSLAVGMFPASFLIGVAIFYGGLWGVSWVVPYNLLDVTSETAGLWGSVGIGLAFVWSGALLGVAGTRRALALGPLQAALAARPSERAGGSACCRHCGAPLTYGPADLGVRCGFCECDNLLRIPERWVRRARRDNVQVGKAIESVDAAWLAEQQRLSRFRRLMALALTVPTGLSLLAFSTGGTNEATFSWQVASRGEGTVLVETARRSGQLWYSEERPVPVRNGHVELDAVTTQPYCAVELCRVYVRLPAHRGETWQVGCTPADAPLFVEAHRGYARVSALGDHDWPASYGTRVASGRCGDGLTLDVSRTGWHLVVVQMPGDELDEPVHLSLTRVK